MSRGVVGHFQVIPRSRRTREAIGAIRHRSRQFKLAFAADDVTRMEAVSSGAWDALTVLFETLRNERDHRYLDASELTDAVGLLIDPVTQQEQVDLKAARKIDRSHPGCRPLSLGEALNKPGHYNADVSSYRIDGRGAHYLILGGRRGHRYWSAEILISRLCEKAAAAAKSIRQFPRP